VGEIYTNFSDFQLGVIDATKNPQDLLAIRFHSATAKYQANDIVVYGDTIYQAKAAVGPKAFTATDWTAISGANQTNNSVTTGSVTITPMTPGSVVFAGTGSTLTQDNANLYYDDVNNRLSIGSTVPTRNLDVTGTFGVTGNSVVGGTLDVAGTLGVSGQLNVTGQAGFASLARFTSTDAIAIPVGTDLQRPTGAALLQGEIRYNTTQNAFEGFNGSSWGPLSAVSAHPIQLFSATGSYATNELVIYNGNVYRANGPVTAGAWNGTQWTQITHSAGNILLWGGTTNELVWGI
jgi:hypothetical protein